LKTESADSLWRASWIPAFAGMTERVQEKPPAGVWGVPRFFVLPSRVGNQDKSMTKEVQEKTPAGGLGVSPRFSILPPRVGDQGG
jgi:hypothetical protein